ncbi:MAG TPA: DUF1343 domain-containing protein [Bacteroidales bacterium]|nr:DUF1343 domain-containing protein [Bacteroidales bacterium]
MYAQLSGTTMTKITLFTVCLVTCLCSCFGSCSPGRGKAPASPLRTGADQTELYFPLLQGKRFALVLNQSSLIDKTSLADSLCRSGLRPAFLFAPEHGFRGEAQAGETIRDGVDSLTNLTVYSLYGQQKKPSAELMQKLDLVVFDIQDVGTRFYTYLSTLHYLMEACAESGVELVVLDRPNPNDTIDGPVLHEGYTSFVGMHSIPLLHGCTLGELAMMINSEGWLPNGLHCELRVIPVAGWRHGQAYSLPVRPSPNLRDQQAVCLYPSLCLFEGSLMSVGRGTATPFKVVGYPDPRFGEFIFTPSGKGSLYRDQTCYGLDLSEVNCVGGLNLEYVLSMYRRSGMGADFFAHARFFDLLAGNSSLREQILAGWDQAEIRAGWQEELVSYRKIRSKYLLYPDYQE